jgi:hypothetical protein
MAPNVDHTYEQLTDEDGAPFALSETDGIRICIFDERNIDLSEVEDGGTGLYAAVTPVLKVIDRANLDPVRIAARELVTLLCQNLAPIRHAIPGEAYDGIVAAIEELERQ